MPIYSDTQYNFEKRINSFENTLSNISRVPIIGTVSGALKILIGLVQTIVSAILTLAFTVVCDTSKKEYAQVHIKHGLGNMGIGILESIPFIGMVIGCLRDGSKFDDNPSDYNPSDLNHNVRPKSAHDDKFLKYPALEERDVRFINCSTQDSARIQARYQTLLQGNPNGICKHLQYRAINQILPRPSSEENNSRKERSIKVDPTK